MPLVDSAQDSISRDARVYWESFLEKKKLSPRLSLQHLRNFFDPRIFRSLIYDFFCFCSELQSPTDGANYGGIAFEDLSNAKIGDPSPSWLSWNPIGDKQTVVRVVLDADQIDRICGGDPTRTFGFEIDLMLHETGHLQHTDYLVPRTTNHPLVGNALPIHESEAWWFAFAVKGLLIANLACYLKEKDGQTGCELWGLL